jgi:hypothetical protein
MADNKPSTSSAKRSGSSRASGGASKSSGTRAKAASGRKGASATRSAAKPNGSRSTAKTNGNRSTAMSGGSRSTAKSNGRSAAARSRSSAGRSASTRATASSNGTGNHGGVTDAIKQAATKAKGPALAVGAAAAGIAGGLVIKSRGRRKTWLGVPIPKHLPSVDAKSVAKTVGEASRQFAKTSKNVSKDIERAGDQAEKIGKILS